jgi:hypothetical protein
MMHDLMTLVRRLLVVTRLFILVRTPAFDLGLVS